MFNQKLITMLAKANLISAPDLERAQQLATTAGKTVDRTILRLGLLEEAQLLPLLCEILEVEAASPQDLSSADTPLLEELTLPYLRTNQIFPSQHSDGARLVFADPANAALNDEVAFLLGRKVPILAATSAQVRQSLAALDPDDGLAQHKAATSNDALLQASVEGPVAAFVQEMLTDAVLAGASDIHLETTEWSYDLRFRLNGVLVKQRINPDLPAAGVMARLKVIADLNVAERRLPQDGRLVTLIAGRRVDFRFSSLPTQWGESIVCRVLDPKSLKLGWEALGFPADIVAQVRAILQHPHGLFLVTGPTGSGKTTTLYTALAELNQPGVKIVTVEDPVEYDLPGVQQVQVHEEIGLTFARVLRSVLRHDPNVILVGEIRDQETAEIAVRAAQVGRLVLSTLHTNSAEGALRRLVDLGVPEFLARDVLRGVLGQRLVVVSCPACGGAGCGACEGSGAVGRRVEAELWLG